MALLPPYTLLYLYRRRLRVHLAQELFAGLGIAIAVALVFAATTAESSIAGSSGEVVRAVAGPATWQLRARSGEGFPEHILRSVEHLPGVAQAAPLLEQSATLSYSSGGGASAGGGGGGGAAAAPGAYITTSAGALSRGATPGPASSPSHPPHLRQTTIDLAGADTSLAVLDGLGETLPLAALRPGTIGLSRAVAQALSLPAGGHLGAGAASVLLRMRGRATTLRVSAILGPEAVGALARAQVAVMPLARMQQLTGLPGRISRIFVQVRPGALARVRRELRALAGPGLEVAPAAQDVSLLEGALGPSRLASGLFAAIGALLGFLLAFNAMLLTVPERRQSIADLRLSGARRTAIVQIVAFEALCLGACASLLGLLAGWGLSVGVFHQSSAYLSEAFTLGSATILSPRAILIALFGGVLATFLASAVPLLDLRPSRPRDGVFRQEDHTAAAGDALSPATQRRLFAGALALLALAGVLYALAPAAAIAVTALLALATVLAVPLLFACVLALMRAISARRERLITLPVVLASLRTTTFRALALAATGAVALFGSVALGGSRANLLRGIDAFAHSYVSGAPLWITNPGDNQAVDEISPAAAAAARARVATLPAVAAVQPFYGGFLTLGPRRVWVIARPVSAVQAVLSSEIQQGSAATALARLSEGGWIVTSRQIAAEHHTGVGGAIVLPTPTGPARFRIAATTTNLAWPPGVIFVSPADYTRLWTHPAPTALGVTLRPGVAPSLARAQVAVALGAGASSAGTSGLSRARGGLSRATSGLSRATGGLSRATGGSEATSGLETATDAQRQASIEALTSEGLGQLRDISTLLLVAAICAMAAALASSLWQRRAWLAGLRLAGARPGRLRRILALEGALMLGAGCLTGAIAGVYGQVVIDGYLRQVTGFPLASVLTGARAFEVFALVLVLALALTAIPGWLVSRVPPGLALEGE